MVPSSQTRCWGCGPLLPRYIVVSIPYTGFRPGVGGLRPSRCRGGARSGADVSREVLAGEGGTGGDEVGGCAFEDDPAAVVAGAGSEVDDPVGVRHHRKVVLD